MHFCKRFVRKRGIYKQLFQDRVHLVFFRDTSLVKKKEPEKMNDNLLLKCAWTNFPISSLNKSESLSIFSLEYKGVALSLGKPPPVSLIALF